VSELPFSYPNGYQSYQQFIDASFSKKNIRQGGPDFASGSSLHTVGIVCTVPSTAIFNRLSQSFQNLVEAFNQLTESKEDNEPEPFDSRFVDGILATTGSYPKITVTEKGDYKISPFVFQYRSSLDNYVYQKSTSTDLTGNFLNEILIPTGTSGAAFVACLDFNTIEGISFPISSNSLNWFTQSSGYLYVAQLPIPLSLIDAGSIVFSSGAPKLDMEGFFKAPTGIFEEVSGYTVLTDQAQYTNFVSYFNIISTSTLPQWQAYPYIAVYAPSAPKDVDIKYSYKTTGQPVIYTKALEYLEISPLATVNPSAVKEANLFNEYKSTLQRLRALNYIPFGIFTTPTSEEQRSFLQDLSLNGFTAASGVQFFPIKEYSKAADLTDEQKLAVAKESVLEASSIYTETVSTGITLQTGTPYVLSSSSIDISSIRFTNNDKTILYKESKDYTVSGNQFFGTLDLKSLKRDISGVLTYRLRNSWKQDTFWKRMTIGMVPGLDSVHSFLLELREKSEAYSSSSSGLAKQIQEVIIGIERILKIFVEVLTQVNLVIQGIQSLLTAFQQFDSLNIYVLFATDWAGQSLGSTEELKALYLNAQGIPQSEDLYYAGTVLVAGWPNVKAAYDNLSSKYGISDISARPGSDFASKYIERTLQQNPEVGSALRQLFDLIKKNANPVK
jgi:hypothetical protein